MSTLNVTYGGQDVAKNFFSPGETVDMVCELNNSRCQLNATCIKIQLFQRITLKDKFGRTKFLTRLINERRDQGIYLAGQDTMHKISLSIQDLNNPTISWIS
jgi:hypothetical protein